MGLQNESIPFTWNPKTRVFGVGYVSMSPPVIAPFDNLIVGSAATKDRFVQTVNSRNTPAYATKKKFGRLPENPFTWTKLTSSTGNVICTVREDPKPDGTYRNVDFIQPSLAWGKAVDWPVPDLSEINAEMLKRIKGTTWNSPVAAIEARKTAEMVADTVTRILYAYRSLRRGDLAAAWSIFGIQPPNRNRFGGGSHRVDTRRSFNKAFGKNPDEAATNALLELYYGWGPLLADIHDACKTLADRLHSPRENVRTVVVRKRQQINLRGKMKQVEVSPETLVDYELESTFDISMKIKFTSDYAASAASAVGITNPALVVWETIPLSFVYDWILPVGDFLSQIDATSGKNFHSGTLVTKAKHLYSAEFRYREGYQNTGGSDQRTLIVHQRQLLLSFPNMVFPPIEPHGSIKRMLSSIALLNQQVIRSRR